MRGYCQIANEHQLADADQRHGPLRDWEEEGLLLDIRVA